MTWHLAHRNLYITEIIEQSKLQLRLFFHSWLLWRNGRIFPI
jgi:hypothetical protein